jgi:hypothetical protein
MLRRAETGESVLLSVEEPESTATAAIHAGPYEGELAARYRHPDTLACLAEMPRLLASPAAREVASGRNRHVVVELPVAGGVERVIVKAFGRQAWLRDLRDRRRGSKARRTWLAASHLVRHGVGTPRPVGYLERWEGSRLRESYFVAAWQEGAQTFGEALLELYHETPRCESFMDLLDAVAQGVRGMHAAGFLHNDLGNQNVLLARERARWRDFQLVDLNRGRVKPALGLRERGRDLSRLSLPSHLLRLFVGMYWQGEPPAALLRWERSYRWLYGLHSRTRPWRHPIREARRRREEARGESRKSYPAPRDMWIWDERSGQPIAAVLREERLRLYPASRYARVVVDTLRAAPRVWREYRALRAQAFKAPVAVAGRVGMAVNPTPATLERELALLAGLGAIPAFVRFYHHEGAEQRRFRAETVRALRRNGHRVAIALVQDRRAVLDPGAWRDFAGAVLDEVGELVDLVEVGHNINRAKWGLWDFRDLRALYAPLPELQARFPHARFTGPAAIDFEYPFVLCALRDWPWQAPLAALSHHLYVDRRGAPENCQAGFCAWDKFTLLRAIARSSGRGADRVIVSEVNWALAGTGVYSPVGAPYERPGTAPGGDGVTEETYGEYMLRYLGLAVGCGMVDQVYWWRLAGHGFGLVDDLDGSAWRPRPAYAMLQRFLALLGESTFVGAEIPPYHPRHKRQGGYRLAFRRPDGEVVVIAYAHGPALPFPASETFGRVEDVFGRTLERAPRELTGRPVYLRQAVL